MTEDQKKKAIKILRFAQNKEFAIFNELQDMNKTLASVDESCKKMSGMEMPVIPPYPEMPSMPEMDMSETNELLKKLLDKDESWDIKLTLK